MGRYSLFQMSRRKRDSLITGHLFYVEQARERLLNQFDVLERTENAEAFVRQWMDENAHRFNPDLHDGSEFYEEACNCYQSLLNLGRQTRLSVVAGMYHEWEKSLRQWLTGETRHWHWGRALPEVVWKANFGEVMNLLEALGWKVRERAYFPRLDACRLVVNVYKHGNGSSFNELKKKYPEYLPDPFARDHHPFLELDLLDHTYLTVSNDQLQAFSDAIVAFWTDAPGDIWDESIVFPEWFVNAWNKDQEAERQQGENSS